MHSSNLTIVNLKPEDSGEYRCTVSNSTGKIISDYVKLVVQGKHDIVSIMELCSEN